MYVINPDIKYSKGTHRVGLFIYKNVTIYFDSFGIEYVLQQILNKIGDKTIYHNKFKTQDNESIMYRFDCVASIEYILAGKKCVRKY